MDRKLVSELPDFVKDAVLPLQSLKTYQYFDFFLISGRFFDPGLLYKGFSLIYSNAKTTVEVSTSDKNKNLTIKKGEMLIVPDAYNLAFKSPQSSFFKISVSGLYLVFCKGTKQKEETYRCECHPISENKQHLLDLFTEFQKSYKKVGLISKFRTDSLLKLLIADTLDLADGHRQNSFEKGKRRESYNKLSVYLLENVQHTIDSNNISNALGFSVQYLNSLSNEFRNMSLKELVNFYRLELSRKMLVNTDSAVAELASDCGFKGAPYFIKLFKKTYGVTPLQCRKKLRHRESKAMKEFHKVTSFEEIKPSSKKPIIEPISSKSVSISIINTSLTTVILSWLHPIEPEVEMYRLKPGQRIHLGTGCGECWTTREESGELIAYYSVPNKNCQIMI